MVSNGKIPSVLFHLEMARIVFQLHREIFSPRGKKKRRRRRKKKKKVRDNLHFSSKMRDKSRLRYFISLNFIPIWIMVTDRAVIRKIHMFSSPSIAFVYSL